MLKNFTDKVSYETFRNWWMSSTSTWSEILILFLLISTCFSVRYVFDFQSNYLTGVYSDFTTISIYLSDFALVALVILNYKSFTRNKLLLLTTWFIPLLALIFYQGQNEAISLFLGTKITLLIATSLCVTDLRKDFIAKSVPQLIVILAVIQSVIGIFQFLNQKSLGLTVIGESVISPSMTGVAKIVAHGTPFIRAYGTFPHSNVLSVFLLVGLISAVYLIINYNKATLQNAISLAIITWGLAFTFSRSAWLASTTCLILLMSRGLINKLNFKRSYHVGLQLLCTFLVIFTILNPFIRTRATITGTPTTERSEYVAIAVEMISDTFPFGIGAGKSILNMQNYSNSQLSQWAIQPIHNYYLLVIAELGLLGIILLFIIFNPIFLLIKGVLKKPDSTSEYIIVVFVGFSILMLFDHYFYTIEQSRLLLWLFVIFAYNYAIILQKSRETTYDSLSQQ